MLILLLAALRLSALGADSVRETEIFRLYKFQQPIGIERNGSVKTVKAPAVFFFADSYAPIVATEQLWRYWAAHGRPAELTVFPAGRVSFERRGKDEVTDDAGKSKSLERYALSGLAWGRETVWMDSEGRLAALKAVDGEF